MKSEELFFEDLNFFRFFFSAAAKKRSSFSPLFFHLFRFFFSLCVGRTQTTKKDQKQPKNQKDENKNKKKDDFFESSSSVKNYHNCLSLSSHFSFTHHDSLSSLSSFGARRAFGVFFITRGGGRAKNNFEW